MIISLLSLCLVCSLFYYLGHSKAKMKSHRILDSILYHLNGMDPETPHDKHHLQQARRMILDEMGIVEFYV